MTQIILIVLTIVILAGFTGLGIVLVRINRVIKTNTQAITDLSKAFEAQAASVETAVIKEVTTTHVNGKQ